MITRAGVAAAAALFIVGFAPAAARADSAILTIVDAGANTLRPTTQHLPGGDPATAKNANGTGPTAMKLTPPLMLGHEYTLLDFSAQQAPSVAVGSSSAGHGAAPPGLVTLVATLPLDHSSDALMNLTAPIADLTVAFRSSGQTIIARNDYKMCRVSSAGQTGSNVKLTFVCLASASRYAVESPAPRTNGTARQTETFIEYQGARYHITDFSVDASTAQSIGSISGGAGAGIVTFSQFAFKLPLDGNTSELARLAQQGMQQKPLKISFVRAGDPIDKAFLIEEFELWSVKSTTTEFSKGVGANSYVIEYAAKKITFQAK